MRSIDVIWNTQVIKYDMMINNFQEFIDESSQEDTLTPEQHEFLKKCVNGSYKVVDGLVDVEGNVDFKSSNKILDFMGIKFGKVTGHFDCSGCTSLTSLEGAPHTVGGDFTCSGCTSLTSLKGAPQSAENFYCWGCTNLTSLVGAPHTVGGDFFCSNCTSLTSLKGAPSSIGGDFTCYGCTKLTSLEGAPQKVGGDFSCGGCNKLPKEEVDLLGKSKKIFSEWLKSGQPIKDFIEDNLTAVTLSGF